MPYESESVSSSHGEPCLHFQRSNLAFSNQIVLEAHHDRMIFRFRESG